MNYKKEYKLINAGLKIPRTSLEIDNINISKILSNDYSFHSGYGKDPRVYIFGYKHKGNQNKQEDQLYEILTNIMKPKDILLTEGNGQFILDLKRYNKDNFFGRLKDFLIKNEIDLIFNDDRHLIADSTVVNSNIKSTGEEKYYEEFLDIVKKRDYNFCHHKSCGIIPIVKGTTKLYRQLSPENKVVQIFGEGHIYAGNISEELQKARVSYMMFEPK